MPTDYYSILGVSRDASDDEIRRAYKKSALKYHPDRNKGNPDAEAKFKGAAEAYAILKDPVKRQVYDATGRSPAGEGPYGSGPQDIDLSDIFSMFDAFSGGFRNRERSPAGRQRGANISANVKVTLNDVLSGTERPLSFKRTAPCEGCGGAGFDTKAGKRTCNACDGYGKIDQAQSSWVGRIVTKCPACSGTGQQPKKTCSKCEGKGVCQVSKSLTIKVPPGIHDGQIIRVRGEGHAGRNGGSPGDFYCHVTVEAHRDLERHDSDLIFRGADISLTHAVLGGKLNVQTLEKSVTLTVPPGTPHGTVLRLAGHGMPRSSNAKRRGDLLVQVSIKIPTKLTDEQRKLFGLLGHTGL